MFNRKKDDPFFNKLAEIAVNVQKGLHFANDFHIHNKEDLAEISKQMKQYES